MWGTLVRRTLRFLFSVINGLVTVCCSVRKSLVPTFVHTAQFTLLLFRRFVG